MPAKVAGCRTANMVRQLVLHLSRKSTEGTVLSPLKAGSMQHAADQSTPVQKLTDGTILVACKGNGVQHSKDAHTIVCTTSVQKVD